MKLDTRMIIIIIIHFEYEFQSLSMALSSRHTILKCRYPYTDSYFSNQRVSLLRKLGAPAIEIKLISVWQRRAQRSCLRFSRERFMNR